MTAPDRGAHTKSPLLRRGRPHMTLGTRAGGPLGVRERSVWGIPGEGSSKNCRAAYQAGGAVVATVVPGVTLDFGKPALVGGDPRPLSLAHRSRGIMLSATAAAGPATKTRMGK